MIKCNKLDNKLIISNSGILFSSQSIFDIKDELFRIESRNCGILRKEKIHNFSEVDQISVNGRIGHDKDEGKEFYYIIDLLDTNLNSIWHCEIVDDEELFQRILEELQSIFKSLFEEKALRKYSIRCNSCGRVISKVSTHCIYCGVKNST